MKKQRNTGDIDELAYYERVLDGSIDEDEENIPSPGYAVDTLSSCSCFM